MFAIEKAIEWSGASDTVNIPLGFFRFQMPDGRLVRGVHHGCLGLMFECPDDTAMMKMGFILADDSSRR